MANPKTLEELQQEYGLTENETIEDIFPIMEGDPRDAFSVIRSNLEIINSSINSINKPKKFSDAYTGEIKRVRSQLTAVNSSPTMQARRKKFVYGIVLAAVSTPLAPDKLEIYIDVPGYNECPVSHPDDVSLPSFRFQKIQHLKFYPVNYDENLGIVPIVGGIAKVEVSPTFPTYSEDYQRENIFLGMYDERGYVSCRTDLKDISTFNRQMFDSYTQAASESSTITPPSGSYKVGDQLGFGGLPVAGAKIISIFGFAPSLKGPQEPPEFNSGIDLEASAGAVVFAAASGEVVYAGTPANGDQSSFHPNDGNSIAIKHARSTYTTYSHLANAQGVKVGEKVIKGQPIGTVGMSGGASKPMLHFELRRQMVYKKSSINPENFLRSVNFTSATTEGSQVSDTQNVPAAFVPPASYTAVDAYSASRPKNRPKMLITKFNTDKVSADATLNKGTDFILAREDITSDLESIKNYLNFYEIPFSCRFIDISLKNNNLSPLCKVGLEINLNPNAGLVKDSYLEKDEYYIGPNYSKPCGMGYRLNIYGNIKRKAIHEKYKYEEKILDIYSVNGTYLKNKPNIKKILRPVVDISKMFYDHGFIQAIPSNAFFEKSDTESSKWFVWYKPANINLGDTYRSVLDTVYDLKKYPYLEIPDMIWNGEKFSWAI